jgi:phosphoglycerate kinase
MTKVKFLWKTIRDVEVRGKQILVRADYNVPLTENGEIADDFRVEASLATLKYLIERGAKIVIMSHMGRPKSPADKRFSLKIVAEDLAKKLGQKVEFIEDSIGEDVAIRTAKMSAGEVILLENLRFYPEEEKNSRNFAKKLAEDTHAELFVQDGFGVVHRAHASTSAITEFLPSVAGLLLEQEYVEIKSATDDPNRPLTAIMGGAKISDKIPLVKKFVEIADTVIIGGAMANNFLKYSGKNIANSLVETDVDDTIREILDAAKEKWGDYFAENFVLPTDVAIASDGDFHSERTEVSLENNPLYGDARIFDLGAETIARIREKISNSGTVIWNGDLGIDNVPQFSRASIAAAETMTKTHIISVVGGGDTADFARHWDKLRGGSFTHVSTGGGASLELMAGDELPGIVALMRK